jgi:hypothetical protein
MPLDNLSEALAKVRRTASMRARIDLMCQDCTYDRLAGGT